MDSTPYRGVVPYGDFERFEPVEALSPIDVDTARSVALYACAIEDLGLLPHWTPGAMVALADKKRRIIGYHLGCPGCGEVIFLGLVGDEGTCWKCTSGRPADIGCLTLAPDIVHSKDAGGCGWRGRILRGNAYPTSEDVYEY